MPLPDPPLVLKDVPTQPCAVLSQLELVDLLSAHFVYQIARADFEKKRAGVTLKLLQCARLESEEYEVEFNQSGGLIITDQTSLPMERIVIGDGNSRPRFIR